MLEDIRLAFQGIWNHKLRSALTMLGIIIGIGSIIAIVSTIKGTNEQIKKNLVGAGNDAVNVQLYQGDWPIDLRRPSLPGWGAFIIAYLPNYVKLFLCKIWIDILRRFVILNICSKMLQKGPVAP